MIQPKGNFVDRVEQSIVHLKNNLIPIALPITLFNIFFLIVIPSIISLVLPLEQLTSGDISQKIPMLVALGISIGVAYLLVFTLLLIPVQIAMIKTIKETLAGSKSTMSQYIGYGFKNTLQAFKTYWYIFAYVYLIPALLFIVGGLVFIIATMLSSSLQSQIMMVGGIIMGISVFVTIIFTIYRGTKATFGLISAIDGESFTKDNFHTSVGVSKKKWWRVFGNLFGIGFIVGCVVNLVSFIVGMVSIFSSDWSDMAENFGEGDEVTDIEQIIAEFSEFNIGNFIGDIIATGFGSILGTLIAIFSYIFFIRLRSESKNVSPTEKEIEL